MKKIVLVLLFVSNFIYSQQSESKITPTSLVQQQLEAYNKGDIDAFLEPYAQDVEIYDFPNTLTNKGKDKIRPIYESMFDKYKNLHCKLVNRIIDGNTIIDQEQVTFEEGGRAYGAIAIYKIENNKIAKVYFIL